MFWLAVLLLAAIGFNAPRKWLARGLRGATESTLKFLMFLGAACLILFGLISIAPHLDFFTALLPACGLWLGVFAVFELGRRRTIETDLPLEPAPRDQQPDAWQPQPGQTPRQSAFEQDPWAVLARRLTVAPQGPEDWEVTDIVYEELPRETSVGFVGGKLCFSSCKTPEYDTYFATCQNLTPSGPEDWEFFPVDTDDFTGPGKLVVLNDQPHLAYGWNDGLGTRGIHFAQALTALPETAADWQISTALRIDNYAGSELVVTDQGPVIMTSTKRTNGYWQLLALYPPVNATPDQPWTVEEVNPNLLDDNSSYRHLLFNDGWLICIYSDFYYTPGEESTLKCAVANMPARSTL